jgi:hypothetical protein
MVDETVRRDCEFKIYSSLDPPETLRIEAESNKVEQLTRIPTSVFPVEQATEYALYASLRRLPLPQVQAPDDIR